MIMHLLLLGGFSQHGEPAFLGQPLSLWDALLVDAGPSVAA